MALTTSYMAAAIDRSRTVLSIMAVILLAGIIAYFTIPIEANPDVQVPVILVTVPHEGISPEDAERLLSRPMEQELKTIEGVKEVNSYSSEGSSTVVVRFDYSFNSKQAMIDVRDAVDRAKAKMPSTIQEPVIQEVSAAEFPIITICLGGKNVPSRVLYHLARNLKDRIEDIPDVLEANIQGEREDLLEAVVDPSQLEAYGITNDELIAAVAKNNRLIPAGDVDTGKGSFAVKVPSVIESASDILSLPIKATSDGVVTLADVTKVRRTFKDAATYTFANGEPAVAIEVSQRKGYSLIQAVNKVKAVVNAARANYPSNVKVSYIADQAPDTLEQINTLQGNIVTAMFLVLTVVVAAVGIRSGLLVALGIPFSFLFAFIIVKSLGYTYNFMVMFGLLLGLGMLVDGAIVVVEMADRRMEEGVPPRQAYIFAIRRMFWPVVASTLTTLAAFLPLMFWPGVTGGFMKYLPVTVFAVLTGSLLYALLFAPVLGALVSKARPRAGGGNILLVEEGRFDELRGLLGVYARILQFTTRHPLFVAGLAMFAMVAIITSYSRANLGMQFFTNVDPTLTGVNIAARGNYSVAETRDIVRDVEQRIAHVGFIKSIYTRVGGPGISRGNSSTTADQIGNMFVELSDRHDRKLNGFQVEDRFRQAIAHVPGVRAELQKQDPGPPVGKDIQIELIGDNLATLTREARRIHKHLDTMAGLTSIDDTTPVPGIEWEVKVDRAKAAMMGADVSSVGAAVQLVTNGVLVGKYRPDDVDDEVDIRVRYPRKDRSISELDHLRIATRDGSVPISSFVQREAKPKISTIHREDGNRVMYVQADTRPGVLADTEVKKIQHWLDTDAHMDPSVRIKFRGANEEQNKSFAFIGEAFTLALALMGILLITQFNSFYQALLILSAVIMSTVGVLLSLVVLRQPFSAIMTGVGIVALAGIIVNNNIVLIDTFNYLRKENADWSLARVVVQTGCQRIRPVFLTTFTTGFGLLPMAMGVSIDLIGRQVEVGGPVATFWVQLASAIVFGLTFATILTLIVTPAMLIAPTALRELWSRSIRRQKDDASDDSLVTGE